MLKKIKEEIDKYNNIILSAHINPDGDALGSLLAFKFMIEKYNKDKKVEIVLEDTLPRYIYQFEESKYIKNRVENEIELVIQLDTANKERAAIDNNVFLEAKNTINIDHHISNKKYLNINYVENISSTSELLYKFIDIFNIELDEKISKFLYLGIINDTGNFRHSNVGENTFIVASKLIKNGINNREITSILFNKSREKVKIFGDVFINYVYVDDIKFGYYYLSNEKMREFNVSKDDADGVSELLLTIEGIEVALFIREDNEGLKGSFRSNRIDVNSIASNFEGGGHILAAGFKTSKFTKDEILNKTIELIRRNYEN